MQTRTNPSGVADGICSQLAPCCLRSKTDELDRPIKKLAVVVIILFGIGVWHNVLVVSKARSASDNVLESATGTDAGDTESQMLSLGQRLDIQPSPPSGFDATKETFDIPSSVRFDASGPRPGQFILLTAADGGNNNGVDHMLERALQNRQEYCDAHGYICHWVDISRFDGGNYGPHWKKLPAIIETFQTFPDAQWIWMLDVDAIIMSPEVDIVKRLLTHNGMRNELLRNETIKRTEYFTQSQIDVNDIDLVIAQDHGNINTGSFMVRRTESVQWILDMWRSEPIRRDYQSSDQGALVSNPIPLLQSQS